MLDSDEMLNSTPALHQELQRTREALKCAQNQLAEPPELLDELSIAWIQFDQTGCVCRASQSAFMMLELKPGDLVGLPLAAIFPEWEASLRTLGPAPRVVYHARLERYFRVRLLPTLLTMEDVTVQRRREIKTEQLASVTASSPEFVGMTDTALTFRYINPAGLKMIGRKPDSGWIDTPMADLHPPWAIHRIAQGVAEADKIGQWSGETALWGADGQETPLLQVIQPLHDEEGVLQGYSVTARDISESQRRERELRDSESRFRRAIIEAPIPVLLVAEDGELLALSDSLTALTGYQPREFTRLSHWLLTVHRDGAEQVRDSLASLLRPPLKSEGPYIPAAIKEFEAAVYTRSGNRLFWRFSGATSGRLEDGRSYAVIMALDVTDRLEKERALEEGAIFLRRTLDSLSVFAAVCTPDGVLIEANLALLEAGGLQAADVVGKRLEDTLWWSHSAAVQTQLRQAINRASAGRPSRYDVEIRVAHDQRITIDFQIVPMRDQTGRITHLVPSGLDISERKWIEKEVEAGRERFRSLLNSTAEGIFGLDLEGRCTFANSACLEIFGYPSDAGLLGQNAHQLFHHTRPDGSAFPENESPIVAAFKTGQPAHLPRDFFFRPDGTSFPVEYWAHPTILDERVVGCVVTFWDISELTQAQAGAEVASRAKSDFLANMSHEIRTPMAAILGYVDILLRQISDPDNILCLQIVQRNGVHLLEIINDILDLSKIEAGSLQLEAVAVSVHAVVAEVVSLMQVKATEKNLQLRVEYLGPMPDTISSDPTRLRQVLLNLLGNAIKFTSKGKIRLVVALLAEQELLEFAVEDTGMGIAASRFTQIFEPFSQADTSVTRRFEGTGLGLAISRELVQLMGGSIRFESQEGSGSIFTFTVATGSLQKVELIESNHLEESAPQAGVRLPSLSGRKVLVVDDRHDIRYLVQSYLEEVGAQVETAGDGQVALDFLEKSQVDIVVLDMQMPVLDGYATARELRRRQQEVPILAVTASAMKGDREACLAAGCNSYLSKPVDRAALVHQVASLLKQGGGLRILIVEDNPMAAAAVRAMVSSIGCEAEVANSGQQALEWVEKRTPDFVLIDLGLPDMDGWQLLKRLRALHSLSQTRFIAHSGRDPRDLDKGSNGLKFDLVAQKPVSREALVKLLFHWEQATA